MSKQKLVSSMVALLFAMFMCVMASAQSSSGQSTNATSNNPNYGAKAHDANNPTGKTKTASDNEFLKKAAEGGMAEVEFGKIAEQKGNDTAVKDFGKRMVDDHTKANDQLKDVAQKENVTLPTTLDAKDKAFKESLEKASGEQFDRLYMSHMVRDHRKDIREFQHEANNGKDPDVKQFAQQTLPTLQDHLKQAESIAPKENKSQASNKY